MKEIDNTTSHVTIFMSNGSTVRFENVEFIKENLEHSAFPTDKVFAFWYKSANDGLRKVAAFDMTNSAVAGYSIYNSKLSEEVNGGDSQ